MRTEYAIEVTQPAGSFNAEAPLVTGLRSRIFSSRENVEAEIEALAIHAQIIERRAAAEDLDVTNEWHLVAARLRRTTYRIVCRQVGEWSQA